MSSKPKVYGIWGSPPFGAVTMCAKVLGVELDVEIVNLLNMEQLNKEYIQKCPQHTVPLLDDNGFFLPDSHAINGYLVNKYGKENDPLYPKNDIKRRALIDHRLHMDSGIVAAKGFSITRTIGFKNVKPPQEAFDDLKEAFALLNKQIEVQNTKYMVGDILSIADFSIYATVSNWGFFLKNWENEFPHIKAYMERMKQEDWPEVNDKGVNAFKALFEVRLKELGI
ncbi:glutathione S-transferase 1-1-like [Anthonomus grandis grandis]|uniref:glutathione S-transferase 1-1-like n=1 Tax=Anthonomus grandis grandis TaxID=2921223 RepID=UPI0021666E60|nr:glutathione S-transferase 1-1-like [Anthonomus grandis grandis]XP_050308055.1 glutathione S-transferase 1-1-like [Anthonomus grandis grandis]XP_050308056.1 glutathione S-transferase 1-1-like [Anthonomus grandis grandis]XP_050308062.1 glutathione S-transferase 1-1-like [Anthonomus grandis grandis]